MPRETALYVGRNCVRLSYLEDYLKTLGMTLHIVSSPTSVNHILCKYGYDLILIQMEYVRKNIFNLCSFARHKQYEAIIIVLMHNIMPIIESKLFECGVDDIAAGCQWALKIGHYGALENRPKLNS